MKNIYLIIFAFIPFLFFGQSVDFKIKYTPQTKYLQKVKQSIENTLQYTASDDILEKLKEKGVQNPTVTTNINTIESVFKSGKLQSDGTFPISLEFLNSIDSENKTIIPNGTLIYGRGTVSKMPTLDSIVAKDLDETFKKNLLETVQSTFSQLDLPAKTIKVGESFSQETPFNIPIAGISLEMVLTTTYKLVNIVNKTANFDISVLYTMKISVEKYNIQGSGTGTGKMNYDMVNHFPTKYDLDTEMVFDMKQETFSLQAKTKSGFYQTVQILKN
ncbi:hypothetical protein B0A79_01045 [Flavobacterium piscis]|uniref:Uncharacterized protein n=1 Tax=Flavobacterium piscis TaxID=1114874 RepID=A0ABX2XMW5_9FLAO|nr:hypothetical protein [Flavobacterium piscis]OCB77088.1 hypothetical protein FLP_03860 [Flavobacterium piscis]OXG08229.1 hypothetical protein B0A79_01045 [Flavobacterium piscis]